MEKKLTIGAKLRILKEKREQEEYEKTRSKSLPSVEELKKKFKLRDQSTENLTPAVDKILKLVRSSEDDKKRAIGESADIAKKNVDQISGINDSFGRILSSQVKTTGLLRELLQTVKDNKEEEESKQRKSWFNRLVDAAVGLLGIGGAGFLGAASMHRANEISGAVPIPPVMPDENVLQPSTISPPDIQGSATGVIPPQTTQQHSHVNRNADTETDSVVQPPVATRLPSMSILASQSAHVDDSSETTSTSPSAPRSFPKEPVSARMATPTRMQETVSDNNVATPLLDNSISAPNPKAPVAEAIDRPPVESTLRDLPSTLRDYTFKANEIKFKADEFKFEQPAVPVMGASESVLGPSAAMPISMPAPTRPGGGSSGGGGGSSPPGGGGTLEQLDPAIRSIYEKLRSEFPGLGHTSTTEGRLGVAGQAAHGEGKAIDLNMAGLDQAARERLVAAIANIPEVTGIGLYPNSNPNMLHVDAGYTGGRRNGVQRMAWGDNGSRSSLPQTPEWFQNIINPWLSGGSATRIQNAESSVTSTSTTPAATPQRASVSQAPAPMPSPQSTTGSMLAAASAQRSIANDMPPPPTATVIQTSTPDDETGVAAGTGGPQYALDPNDPGPVEPANALQRYSRLFDMDT